jgi:hypothetical protein
MRDTFLHPTALAKKLNLSRARFYQLQEKGIFPYPIYCIQTKRPFYPAHLQKKCMDIRKNGIGLDGHPIFFNTSRKAKTSRASKEVEPQYKEVSHILKQMGLNVSPEDVKNAAHVVYPSRAIESPVEDEVIVEMYKYFHQAP